MIYHNYSEICSNRQRLNRFLQSKTIGTLHVHVCFERSRVRPRQPDLRGGEGCERGEGEEHVKDKLGGQISVTRFCRGFKRVKL